MWSLSLPLTGGLSGDADGSPFTVGPGGIALFSHTRPAEILSPRSRTIVLAIPGSLLNGIDPADVHGSLPSNAATSLLSAFLQDLCVALPTLRADAELSISDALLSLIRGATADIRAGRNTARQRNLRAELVQHVAANLADPLDAESLCAALAVSRSVLYRIVERDGGLRPLVRRLRLEEAHRRLRRPDTSTSIQEIAHAVGYSDSTLFSRHFSKAFGYTAASFRDTLTVPPRLPVDSPDIPLDFSRATDNMANGPSAS